MGFTLVSCVLFSTLPTFGDSKESVVLEGILEALMNQDSEELTRLCNDHVIKSLDTSVGGAMEGTSKDHWHKNWFCPAHFPLHPHAL